MVRIVPLQPPYDQDVEEQLTSMMPRDVAPIALFRMLTKNLVMARAMHALGTYELGRQNSLTLRDREIVIVRTCARTGCEYEWGVHIGYFAARAAFTTDQITSLTQGQPTDPCWPARRDRLLIEAADALHDDSDLPDALWAQLANMFDEEQLLDLLLLAGWYHAISYLARASRLPLEPDTPTFTSVAP